MHSVRIREWLQSSPNLVWISLGFGLFYWLAESVLHMLLYQQAGILTQFFPDEIHELFKRLTFGALILGFCFYAHLQFKERNRLAGTIQKAEARCHSIFEASPNPVLVLHEDGRIIDFNLSALDFFESTPGQLKTFNLWNFLVDSSRNGGYPQVHERQSEPLELEYSVNGVRKVLLLRTTPYDESGDPLLFGLGMDVTEIRKIRSVMEQHCRMSFLGELAVGVGHEIINPANGIINYAKVICNGDQEISHVRQIANRISHESERIAAIAVSLLALGQPANQSKKPVRVEDALENAISLIEPSLRKSGICLQINVAADLPPMFAIASQIQQVFINMLTNARDALNEKFSDSDNPDKRIEIVGAKVSEERGAYIRISFLDHGTGIPEKSLEKVMTPFFTSKAPDRGIGLGLSICHGIVADHGGRIEVESAEDMYAKFTVDLPAAPDDEAIE